MDRTPNQHLFGMDLIKISWFTAGALLANSEIKAQVSFFRGFVKELMAWETFADIEFKLMYINMELTDNEKEILNAISFKEATDE